MPAARSAFAAVYLDWGEGPVYLGLYTVVEDPCDSMRGSQLAGDGPLYKPWGDAARWRPLDAAGAADLATYFEPCDDADDVSGVAAAITALHAPADDPTRWRAGLEAVFDVRSFLRTLAVSRVIVNWDSYGCMHHNYFLYADPALGGRLAWFPWDLNETLLLRAQSGCPDPGSVMLDEIVAPPADGGGIDTDWPLIGLLLGDPVYRAVYEDGLRATLAGAFAADDVVARMRRYHALVAPFVVGPTAVEDYPYTNTSAEGFTGSLSTGPNALLPHVAARHAAVTAALGD